jgi:hypothetical protein
VLRGAVTTELEAENRLEGSPSTSSYIRMGHANHDVCISQ